MRWLTLLLALVFATGALAPCALERSGETALARPASLAHGGTAGGPAHHGAEVATAMPCHAEAGATLTAPCPCGCEGRAAGASGLGSLGVAVLPEPEPLPAASRPPFGSPALPTLARAPTFGVEKVPRVA
jgi:hypothetical protein